MPEKKVSSRQATATEDVHFRVMRLLEVNSDMSQRELAKHVGISLASLNYFLKALMGKVFVKLENFLNSEHKFNYVYILTSAGIAEKALLTSRFLKRKIQQYETLNAEIEGLEHELRARPECA